MNGLPSPQVAPAARREFSHAAELPIADRCDNWGRCYRGRTKGEWLASAERVYRNRWARHWDYDPIVGVAPQIGIPRDLVDGALVNGAWQSIPSAFYQTLLAAWYVRLWSERNCLATAREVAGEKHQRRTLGEFEFEAHLAAAHLRLREQLALPAVFRLERLVVRVRQALELDEWRPLDSVYPVA